MAVENMSLSDQQRECALLIAAAGPGTEENLSYTEIAKRVGTTAKTLRIWRALPEFQECLDESKDSDGVEQVRDMLLTHAVSKGSHNHAKIFLDRFGPKQTEKESRFDAVFDLTDEDLAHIRLSIAKHYGAMMEPV